MLFKTEIKNSGPRWELTSPIRMGRKKAPPNFPSLDTFDVSILRPPPVFRTNSCICCNQWRSICLCLYRVSRSDSDTVDGPVFNDDLFVDVNRIVIISFRELESGDRQLVDNAIIDSFQTSNFGCLVTQFVRTVQQKTILQRALCTWIHILWHDNVLYMSVPVVYYWPSIPLLVACLLSVAVLTGVRRGGGTAPVKSLAPYAPSKVRDAGNIDTTWC